MSKKIFAYVGNWTTNGRGGIGIYNYNAETGATEFIKTVREDVVAGLTMADEKRGVLYSIDERLNNPDCAGIGGGGRVYAFKIDHETGDLTEINHKSSFGTMTAYITGDGTGNGLIICNHSGMETTTHVVKGIDGKYTLERTFSDTTLVHYPILEDGSIGDPDDIYITPPEGNFYSCVHSINLAPDGKSLIVCERNLDRVYLMNWDAENCRFVKVDTAQYESGETHKSGHCPRYSAFHPTAPFVYVNSEYLPMLTVIRYDNDNLETVKIMDVTPPSAVGKKFSQSDICVSPDGKYLYTLYRGINTVCTYRVDEKTGIPTFVQELTLEGAGPRGFRISPDGKFMLVANLETKDVTTLAIAEDGTLSPTGCRVFGQEFPGNITFYEV